MYVNAYVIAVPEDRKEEYARKAGLFAEVAKEFGALEIFENWELEVPNGETTDYRKAVLAKPGEKIVVSWTVWPDRETGATAHKGMFADPRMDEIGEFPIDGSRMILGGFEPIYAFHKEQPGFKLYTVRVFSFKWKESVAFYRDTVGLPLSFLGEEFGWAEFELGTASLGLERCDPDDPEAQDLVGRFAGISIEVDDIQATYQELVASGVSFTAPPQPQPWGGVLAHFEDPDRNVITLLGSSG